MGLIISNYDKENLIDECWYDSSTVYYSKCFDKLNDYKELEVTFKDGRTYRYSNLIIQDYLLFKNGGLDNSQGKALNKFIKKYQFEKLDKINIDDLDLKRQLLMERREVEKLKLLSENNNNGVE